MPNNLAAAEQSAALPEPSPAALLYLARAGGARRLSPLRRR